jgi:hypothetical protein
MNRNKKGQFAKEEPYSSLASLCGFIVIVAGISIIGLNLYRQNKKIEQVEIKQEQQIVEIKEVKEEVKEVKDEVKEVKAEVKEVKKEVVAVKKIVSTIEKQNDYFEIEKAAKVACKARDLGDYCVADLMGIAYAEHHDFDCSKVGDSGSSVGCFQIYRKVHKSITVEQASDIQWSTNWTLNRLISKGYGEYRSFAIRSHNGSPYIPKTKAYLDTVNKFVEQF